tara:strand:+ start:303 stop:737 length:435 start_codon:yes stop_codon:yes gene_type:complete
MNDIKAIKLLLQFKNPIISYDSVIKNVDTDFIIQQDDVNNIVVLTYLLNMKNKDLLKNKIHHVINVIKWIESNNLNKSEIKDINKYFLLKKWIYDISYNNFNNMPTSDVIKIIKAASNIYQQEIQILNEKFDNFWFFLTNVDND